MICGLRAVIYQLNQLGNQADLVNRYQAYFDKLAANALTVFYQGQGYVRCVSQIVDNQAPPTPSNYFMAPGDSCYLDDPYEGEMMTVFMDFYCDWSGREMERPQLWVVKRPMLQVAEYAIDATRSITVQKGYWFSAHEQWKYLELPYVDSQINRRVFLNGERARTWNSALLGYTGMFASVTDVIAPPGENPNYVSNFGIPSIAFQPVTKFTTTTPYGCFPIFMTEETHVALAWYLNMLQGPSMQGPLGSTESGNVTGTAISPVVTWDSKITTFAAMLGGVVDINRAAMKEDKTYDEFVGRIDYEWNLKFGSIPLLGEELPFRYPTAQVPYPSSLGDWPACQRSSS